jgi:hypothetical protein
VLPPDQQVGDFGSAGLQCQHLMRQVLQDHRPVGQPGRRTHDLLDPGVVLGEPAELLVYPGRRPQ